MLSTRRSRTLSASVATLAAVAFAMTGAAPASAAGVGDLSAAVLYEATSPIGSILEDLDNGDDADTNIALPFPVLYNGVVANALCVTTNGYVVPLATLASSCASGAYDQSLAEGAVDTAQSTIGVLLHDINTGNTLWPSAGVALSTVELTANVLTVVTAAPHGYSTGDNVDLWFSVPDPTLGSSYLVSVDSVIDATTFTATVFEFDFANRSATGETQIPYSDVLNDSDADGHADDGFGAVNQVYAGATTFNGRPAFAVTWYRVTSYESENSPTLSDTFQIVLVQDPTPNGAIVGYNFTVLFNFGTVADNDLGDGYDATDPGNECDTSSPADCRFAVGLSYYDAVSDTATSQELFAAVPKANLIDGGAQALVSNSLNSGGVNGRYVLQVVAGIGGSGSAGLAATGSESVPLGLAALALLTAGGVLMLIRRRRVFAR